MQRSPEPAVAPRRFRAPTIDEALAKATTELGVDVDVLEASRIRRGGVGGFFATDLGVEILVAVSSAAALAKPHFYDRVLEEDRPAPASLDELVENVTRSERAAQTGPAPVATGSFAEHFAREMNDGLAEAAPTGVAPTAVAPTRAAPTRAAPSVDPPAVDLVDVPVVASDVNLMDLDALPELPRAKRAHRTHRAAVPREAERPVRATRAEGDPATPRVKRDPLRRPSELATAAASRLIADLADVVARDGSRVQDLSRLRVSVTTPDGAVIELSADIGGEW